MSPGEFHLESLALTMVFVSTMMFLGLAPALLRFPEEFRASLKAWIVGTALVVSTDVAFFIGPGFTYEATLLMVTAGLGIAEWVHALRLYVRESRRFVWPYVLIAIATVLSAIFPAYPTSVLFSSTLFVALYLGAAVAATRIEERRSTGRLLLIAVFVVIALVMATRVGFYIAGMRSGASPGFTSLPRAIMFVIASAGPVVGSLAFVLMCGERLGERLLESSRTDPLTGIANRRAFLDALARTLAGARRRAEPVTVLVVDVDLFKRINDDAGHAAGDEVLTEIARLLENASRPEDTVARLGGEEFGIVVPRADLETARGVAERLRETVARTPLTVDGRSFTLTVSIGGAVSTGGDDSPALLARADALLYEAKRRGRDCVVIA